jgi:hypothetical protein
MYVKCWQTGFGSGQFRTNFEQKGDVLTKEISLFSNSKKGPLMEPFFHIYSLIQKLFFVINH